MVGEQIPTFDWRLVARQVALAPGFVRGRTARFGGSGGGYPVDSRYNHDLSLELFSFSRLMQRGK